MDRQTDDLHCVSSKWGLLRLAPCSYTHWFKWLNSSCVCQELCCIGTSNCASQAICIMCIDIGSWCSQCTLHACMDAFWFTHSPVPSLHQECMQAWMLYSFPSSFFTPRVLVYTHTCMQATHYILTDHSFIQLFCCSRVWLYWRQYWHCTQIAWFYSHLPLQCITKVELGI